MQAGRKYLQVLYTLVREEVGRPRIRDLQAFIEEMRASDVERLKIKVGLVDTQSKLTISTVHRVKGLQYDTVLVMPSRENFPFSSSSSDLSLVCNIDAAEEARLCYVAMTRARNQLYVGWGAREKSWWECKKYEISNSSYRYCLKGSPKEIFVSWPGKKIQVEGGLQNYIEKNISVNDPITLNNDVLRHGNVAVGHLSTATKNLYKTNECPQLRVSNVLRYTCGSYFRKKYPQLWDQLHDNVKRQNWFYIVLVEEA